MEKIDESNFRVYAATGYTNPQCMDETEFFDDLKRFKYLKRLFNKYQETGDLKERLIINHMVVLFNMFEDGATRMLFFKLNEHHDILKPFLALLGRLPEKVKGIGIDGRVINTSEISEDTYVVDVLRSI